MKNKTTLSLLWHFLKGAKRYFLVTILAALITALADMLQPQIIRAAIDCALGGQEGDFPDFVMDLVNRVGGFSALRCQGAHSVIGAVDYTVSVNDKKIFHFTTLFYGRFLN